MEEAHEYKLLVTGDEAFDDYEILSDSLDTMATTEFAGKQLSIVTGMTKGAGALVYLYAHKNNLKCYEIFADHPHHGKDAHVHQHDSMCKLADGVALFGKSNVMSYAVRQIMHQSGKDVFLVVSKE